MQMFITLQGVVVVTVVVGVVVVVVGVVVVVVGVVVVVVGVVVVVVDEVVVVVDEHVSGHANNSADWKNSQFSQTCRQCWFSRLHSSIRTDASEYCPFIKSWKISEGSIPPGNLTSACSAHVCMQNSGRSSPIKDTQK